MSTRLGIRFRWLAEVVKDPGDDCIVWPFPSPNTGGYGSLGYQGRRRKATHVALELVGCPRPSLELDALHSCDNPPCCNPRHLRWGNDADNAADRVERGRHASGEAHGCAKLTAPQVLRIRAAREAGSTFSALGREYGVHRTTIQRITSGARWASVNLERPVHG